ncbi:MAG TPA: SAM-dependent methyltransferase [Vicinamibacterales bacterium]|nr:SAM-dependent methyltransferase [Vicinamibacterales bacterium]
MPVITIVGLGPGPVAGLTREAEQALLLSDKVFVRTAGHPVCQWLRDQGRQVISFDHLYTIPWPQQSDIYEFIAGALMTEASLRGTVVYGLPGSPVVLESTSHDLRRRGADKGIDVKIVLAVGFLDQVLAEVNLDSGMGFQVVLPLRHLQHGHFDRHLPMIVCQIQATRSNTPSRVDLTMKWLLDVYPDSHPVTLVWTDGLPAYVTQSSVVALCDLEKAYGKARYFASLYVPPLPRPDNRLASM